MFDFHIDPAVISLNGHLYAFEAIAGFPMELLDWQTRSVDEIRIRSSSVPAHRLWHRCNIDEALRTISAI